MDEESPKTTNIDTGGGTSIGSDVNTGGGNFAGRDHIIINNHYQQTVETQTTNIGGFGEQFSKSHEHGVFSAQKDRQGCKRQIQVTINVSITIFIAGILIWSVIVHGVDIFSSPVGQGLGGLLAPIALILGGLLCILFLYASITKEQRKRTVQRLTDIFLNLIHKSLKK